jgi:hypothetical protein
MGSVPRRTSRLATGVGIPNEHEVEDGQSVLASHFRHTTELDAKMGRVSVPVTQASPLDLDRPAPDAEQRTKAKCPSGMTTGSSAFRSADYSSYTWKNDVIRLVLGHGRARGNEGPRQGWLMKLIVRDHIAHLAPTASLTKNQL